MNKTVNHCHNCPFYKTIYDEYSLHEQPICTCGLAEFLKYDDFYIEDDNVSLIEPPEWCPIMKDGEIYLKFKKLPICNMLEISKYTTQMEQLDNELNDIEDFESEEYHSKYQLLLRLGEKIELLRNEE